MAFIKASFLSNCKGNQKAANKEIRKTISYG